jgi:hypothetical protein
MILLSMSCEFWSRPPPNFFSGVGLSPLGTAATSGLLYKSQTIDEGDCGAIGGIKIGRGNRSTRRPGLEPGPPRWEASD